MVVRLSAAEVETLCDLVDAGLGRGCEDWPAPSQESLSLSPVSALAVLRCALAGPRLTEQQCDALETLLRFSAQENVSPADMEGAMRVLSGLLVECYEARQP